MVAIIERSYFLSKVFWIKYSGDLFLMGSWAITTGAIVILFCLYDVGILSVSFNLSEKTFQLCIFVFCNIKQQFLSKVLNRQTVIAYLLFFWCVVIIFHKTPSPSVLNSHSFTSIVVQLLLFAIKLGAFVFNKDVNFIH